MDGYFVAPPMPVTVHAAYVPQATPWGNRYYINQSVVNNFWSVRDLWLEDRWPPQSEVSIAPAAQAQPPVYVPHESMTPVVMVSW